jgi:hypothetical protein
MRQDYEKLFTYLDTPEPPDLLPKIMRQIKNEQHSLNLKRRLAIFSLSMVSSMIVLVFAFKMVWFGFADSGFYQFFSLIFSDFEIVILYWQNFAMSLLEALPAASLIIFLASALVFINSLKFLIRDIKVAFNST